MPQSVSYQINRNCRACFLHKGCASVCLRGKNAMGHRPLVIFTDTPDFYSNNATRPYAMHTGQILDNLLARMSVDPADVAYEYTLRCYAKDTLPSKKAERAPCILECNKYRFATIAKTRPKAIVVLGDVSLEAFTGKTKVGKYSERKVPAWEGVVRKFVPHVWVGYSLLNILYGNISDTVPVGRVLWNAATEAGLNPKPNPKVKPFTWPTIDR